MAQSWRLACRAWPWPAVFPPLPGPVNAALIYTTAARGALALATTPLITMLVAALLRIEPLTARKSIGLMLAMSGVVIALAASLSVSPPGAWRGDALMLAGAACMALYTTERLPPGSRGLLRHASRTMIATCAPEATIASVTLASAIA